ncbi:MAG: hypothetical protein U0K78_06045, partial [Agathobacter sp.]|nr:hypothetical protein [Agathobacter sp.]
KQLVDLMGGHITVDSEPNKGTMFSFSIWVESVDEESGVKLTENKYAKNIREAFETDEELSKTYEYGSKDNISEMKTHMSKLILCLEMDNWEKAEMFADSIKRLTSQAPKDIKVLALKLKMAVQKADYDQSVEKYNELKKICDL